MKELVEGERDLVLGRSDLALLTRQLSVMLNAGVPLNRGLAVLIEGEFSETSAVILQRLLFRVERGQPFSMAAREFPRAFNQVYLAMLEVGEETGQLAQTLDSLADWLMREDALIRQLRGAMTYPLVVLLMAGALTAGFFGVIFPGFAGVLSSLPHLPLLTRCLVVVSDAVRQPWVWFATLVLGLFLLFLASRALRRPGAAALAWRALSEVPVLGRALRAFAASRFTSALSLLTGTGVDLLKSFRLASLASGSPVLMKELPEGLKHLTLGRTLAEFMKQRPESFPPMASGLVMVAEESATLPNVCHRLELILAEEAELGFKALLAVVEPLLLAFMSVLVGLLVIGVALPMYGLLDNL